MHTISALVCNKDEPLFRESISSIIDYVDRLVIVDGSYYLYEDNYEFCSQYNKIYFISTKPDYKIQILKGFKEINEGWQYGPWRRGLYR